MELPQNRASLFGAPPQEEGRIWRALAGGRPDWGRARRGCRRGAARPRGGGSENKNKSRNTNRYINKYKKTKNFILLNTIKMLEEDIQERMKLLIPSLNLNEDELRKNFHFISRVSQPDDIEDFLSFEEEQHQKELLNWVKSNSCKGKHPLIILDNLSNLVELRDDNSAGQMQNFNMMVTKARKFDCSMVIVHHTGKQMTVGPDGVPTWRGSFDMASRLDKTICLMPCD